MFCFWVSVKALLLLGINSSILSNLNNNLKTLFLWAKTTSSVEVIPGVITLVGITSAGIFGYLSNAYQGATIEFEKESTALMYKEDRLDQLKEERYF